MNPSGDPRWGIYLRVSSAVLYPAAVNVLRAGLRCGLMGAPSGDETSSAAELAAPTEVAGAADAETQSAYAWGLADDETFDEVPGRWTPGRITALAVACSVALVITAAAVAYLHLRKGESEVQTPITPTSIVVAAPVPPVTVTTVVVQQPPKTVTRQAPVPGWIRPGPDPSQIAPQGRPVAPEVLPDLIPYNSQFLVALRAHDWVILNETFILQRGHSVCSMLRDGESRDVISRKLMGVESQLTYPMAMQFTDIVTDTYPNCP